MICPRRVFVIAAPTFQPPPAAAAAAAQALRWEWWMVCGPLCVVDDCDDDEDYDECQQRRASRDRLYWDSP